MGNCLRSKRGHFFCSGMNRHNTFNQSLKPFTKTEKNGRINKQAEIRSWPHR